MIQKDLRYPPPYIISDKVQTWVEPTMFPEVARKLPHKKELTGFKPIDNSTKSLIIQHLPNANNSSNMSFFL